MKNLKNFWYQNLSGLIVKFEPKKSFEGEFNCCVKHSEGLNGLQAADAAFT